MGGSGGLLGLLLFPLTGPVRSMIFVLEQLRELVDKELYDPKTLERHLMEVRVLYELGEIAEEDYLRAEKTLTERLAEIRQEGW
ncbi:MAG: gas vesicle protein GvpG [Bacillota bacterium]|nr:gas vesicle protein GvpG [Bacillota bacterium]